MFTIFNMLMFIIDCKHFIHQKVWSFSFKMTLSFINSNHNVGFMPPPLSISLTFLYFVDTGSCMKTCSVLNSPYVHFKFKKYEIAGMGSYGLNRNNRNSFYISLSSADLLIYCYIRKFFTILYFIRVCTLKCTSGVSI